MSYATTAGAANNLRSMARNSTMQAAVNSGTSSPGSHPFITRSKSWMVASSSVFSAVVIFRVLSVIRYELQRVNEVFPGTCLLPKCANYFAWIALGYSREFEQKKIPAGTTQQGFLKDHFDDIFKHTVP